MRIVNLSQIGVTNDRAVRMKLWNDANAAKTLGFEPVHNGIQVAIGQRKVNMECLSVLDSNEILLCLENPLEGVRADLLNSGEGKAVGTICIQEMNTRALHRVWNPPSVR